MPAARALAAAALQRLHRVAAAAFERDRYHPVHIDSWPHLVVERHWKPADLVQRTVSTLQAVLTRPPGRTT